MIRSHARRAALRTPLTALALLGACALLAAGCGSGDDDSSDTSSASDSRTTSTKGTTDDDGGGAEGDAAAAAVIVPGVGMAGVKIDDDEATVLRLLGDTPKRSEAGNEISGTTDTNLVFDDGRSPQFEVHLLDGKTVSQIETNDDAVRTDSGVGPGSTQADVEQAYPEVECIPGDVVVCRLGKEEAGEVATDFMVEDGKVTRVVVGRIQD